MVHPNPVVLLVLLWQLTWIGQTQASNVAAQLPFSEISSPLNAQICDTFTSLQHRRLFWLPRAARIGQFLPECEFSTGYKNEQSTNCCANRQRSATDSHEVSHSTGVLKRFSTPVRRCVFQPGLYSDQRPRFAAAAARPDHLWYWNREAFLVWSFTIGRFPVPTQSDANTRPR